MLKTNNWGQHQPRFFVISMVFLFNTKAAFNKKKPGTPIEFGEEKWRIPIAALTKIVVKEDEKKQ